MLLQYPSTSECTSVVCLLAEHLPWWARPKLATWCEPVPAVVWPTAQLVVQGCPCPAYVGASIIHDHCSYSISAGLGTTLPWRGRCTAHTHHGAVRMVLGPLGGPLNGRHDHGHVPFDAGCLVCAAAPPSAPQLWFPPLPRPLLHPPHNHKGMIPPSDLPAKSKMTRILDAWGTDAEADVHFYHFSASFVGLPALACRSR